MSASDIFHHAHIGNGELMAVSDSPLAAIPAAVQHKLEEWLALELTAERMAQDELTLVARYVANDLRGFVRDIKGGLRAWELAACDYMLLAADPTRIEWAQYPWLPNPDAAFN